MAGVLDFLEAAGVRGLLGGVGVYRFPETAGVSDVAGDVDVGVAGKSVDVPGSDWTESGSLKGVRVLSFGVMLTVSPRTRLSGDMFTSEAILPPSPVTFVGVSTLGVADGCVWKVGLGPTGVKAVLIAATGDGTVGLATRGSGSRDELE